MDELVEVPRCPNCGKGMVFTFAFPYMEWACLPCDERAEFFSGLPKVKELKSENQARKDLWGDDLHRIAIKYGARCTQENCPVCSIPESDFKFKYWKSNQM